MNTENVITSINEDASLMFGVKALPFAAYEYTGWRDETMSWKSTAYLGTALMNSPIYDVKGPEVAQFFSKICINRFDNFKVGKIRHAVLCNEKGQIMTDGVLMNIGENHYRSYWLNPCLEFLVEKYKGTFDIEGEKITGKEFFFQIAGPLSKEILEEASESDLSDLKFANHKMIKICGKDIRILRLGMTGNLAYEIHGDIQYMEEVYSFIWNIGKKKGMRKLGQLSYVMNHTEGGFPNINMHYPLPWYESEELGYDGFSKFLEERPFEAFYNSNRELVGSVGNNLETRFVTPFDVGWEKLVNFDHDFIGRESSEKISSNPKRTVVTLVWNEEDIMEIYGSQFKGREVEPYDYIEDRPVDIYFTAGEKFVYHADKVLVNGEWVGNSVGRQVSQYYRRMVSLAFIDKEYSEVGTELTVLWGNQGSPQKEVRAKVARFPYLDLDRNEKMNV